ncbi:ABC transporter permease, partial [Bordetella avium]|uniref:iron chelate uptake ABC transporter family permease subunit n=1 Tax=Bordetella avium TaxID=521 RepID=UPI000EBE899C
NYARLALVGLLIVSAISAVVGVTAGSIPFLGLIVPNAVSLILGDNMRRAIPWVAIVGRLLLYPYEVPIGTVVGVVGSLLFLWLILSRRGRLA